MVSFAFFSRPFIAVLLLVMAITVASPLLTQEVQARPQVDSSESLRDGQRRLERAQRSLRREDYARATAELARVNTVPFTAELRYQYMMLRAGAALGQHQAAEAVALLQTVPGAANPSFDDSADYFRLLARAHFESGDAVASAAELLRAAELFPQQDLGMHDALWRALEQCNTEQLNALAASADSYAAQGWVELARVSQTGAFDLRQQLQALQYWRRVWGQHPAAENPPASMAGLQEAWEGRPRHIALILPLQEAAGKAIHEGFLSAYYQVLADDMRASENDEPDESDEQEQRDSAIPRISVFDSSGGISANDLYSDAAAANPDLIIGPLDKNTVNQLARRSRLAAPTLALNYADDGRGARGLFQFGLAPEDEIEQAVTLAWNAGYRNAALLTPDSADYSRLQDSFIAAWEGRGGQVVTQGGYAAGGDSGGGSGGDYSREVKRLLAIDSSEARRNRLVSLLPRSEVMFTPRRRGDIDFIFLIANPRQGRQIKPVFGFYFAENLPVYSIPSIYDGMHNPRGNRELEGIIFTDAPWVLEDDEAVALIGRGAPGGLQRLRAMGADIFRLHTRLGQLAAGELGALHGGTGMLTMDSGNRIHRQLAVARFEEGEAVAYDPR